MSSPLQFGSSPPTPAVKVQPISASSTRVISDSEAISLAAEVASDFLEDGSEDGLIESALADLEDETKLFRWIEGDEDALERSMLKVDYEKQNG